VHFVGLFFIVIIFIHYFNPKNEISNNLISRNP